MAGLQLSLEQQVTWAPYPNTKNELAVHDEDETHALVTVTIPGSFMKLLIHLKATGFTQILQIRIDGLISVK